MKDLKIGKKITLSFGIVIAIMALLAVTVILTNVLTISNVSNVKNNSDLQTVVNDSLDSFNAARIQANIVYNVISAEANAAFAESADATIANLNRVYAYIDEDKALEVYRANIDNANNDFVAWRDAVQGVIDDNARLEVLRDELTVLGGELAENVNVAINSQIEELGNEVKSGAASDALLRRSDRVTAASKLTNTMTSFRLDMRTLSQNFDASNIDTILATMDSSISQAEVFSANTERADTKASIDKLIEILYEYREVTTEFGDLCTLAPEKIANARQVGGSTTEYFMTVVGDVDKGMASAIDQTTTLSTVALIIVIAMVVAALIVSLVMAQKLIKAIVPPIVLIKDVAVQVGVTGDLNFTDEFRDNFFKFGETNDEAGETIRSFGGLIDHLRVIGGDLETIAAKDLSIDVELLGEDDVMGNALADMLKSLNEIFEEINRVSNEVASSSGEIANGAQLLAQGSTEQASTIEEISASVEQINNQMDENTRTSTSAAEHGAEINETASEGTARLEQMMVAVK